MKRFLAGMAVGLALGGGFVGAATATYLGFPIVDVMVNGEPLTTAVDEPPPILVSNRVMVPLRAVAEAAGWAVAWEEAMATIKDSGVLQLGASSTVNDITAAILSVSYGNHEPTHGTPSAYITLRVTNRTALIVKGGGLRLTCDDPTVNPNQSGWYPPENDEIGPGETKEFTYRYAWFYAAKIVGITYAPCLYNSETNFGTQVLIGSWSVPTG